MKVLLEIDTTTFLIGKYCATAAGVVVLVALSRYRLAGLFKVRRVLEMICAGYVCLIIYELYLLVAVASVKLF